MKPKVGDWVEVKPVKSGPAYSEARLGIYRGFTGKIVAGPHILPDPDHHMTGIESIGWYYIPEGYAFWAYRPFNKFSYPQKWFPEEWLHVLQEDEMASLLARVIAQ